MVTAIEQGGHGSHIQVKDGTSFHELDFFLGSQRTEALQVADAVMRLLHTFSHRLEALQHVPKVGNLGAFLGKLVLGAHTLYSGIEQVGIAERHIQHGLQRAERGQGNHPVAENAVMYRLVFHLGGQLTLHDEIGVRKVLLEQLPVIQYLYGQVCQSQVAQGHQILIAAFLFLAERGLGKGEEQNAGVKCHVLRGLVLSTKHHARTDNGLRRHAVRTRVLLCLAAASPKSFQIGNLPDVEVVLVLVEHHECIDRLRNPVVHGWYGSDTEIGRVHTV